jgi:RND superfamily putative drug exporter
MHPKKNLAARMGGWSARHRKTAIFGWLAFVVIALVVGSMVGTKHLSNADQYDGESKRAEQALAQKFEQPAFERVLIQSSSKTPSDTDFAAAVTDVAKRVGATGAVTNIETPFDPDGAGLVSADRHSALVQFDMRGKAEDAESKVAPVLAAVAGAQAAHPDFRVEQFGETSANEALNGAFADDLHKAETLSLPITIAILLVVFGALVAAGIPILLAVSSVLATTGLVALPSHLVPVDDNIASVILLIGMAVGIDYSLFYLKRFREERAAGRDSATALEIASATSGRAVLVSGLTVMAAMAGLFLTGSAAFSSMGFGTILVAGVAVLGSLTVLPALISLLGPRVDKGRIPFLGRRLVRRSESRVWGAIIDRVMRRPKAWGLAAAALLVALTIPVLGMSTGQSTVADLPQGLPIVKTYNAMEAAFPGGTIPAVVVVEAADVNAPAVSAGIAKLRQTALASGQVREPVTVDRNGAGDLAVVTMPLAGNGSDGASMAALGELRSELIPQTLGAVPGVTVNVTGEAAAASDSNDVLAHSAPIVFGFVLTLAFLLLLVTFRSIVIPIKAIILNLLSVGAAYGSLVLIFQKGWGESLLGFHSNGHIATWLPLFLFVILFGLSMDYHVFILSRIREAFDRGMSTEDAVAHGIKSTAGVVSSAAVVMVAVFAIFATLSFIDMKEMGIGLAIAVLVDATIIRGVLLPASMKLLGDWNWYLPRWLSWLPKGAISESHQGRRPQVAVESVG